MLKQRTLPMTDTEILSSFNNALYPPKQVKILSELNATTEEHIKEILLRMGVDGRRLPRKKQKPRFKIEKEVPVAKEKEKAADTFTKEQPEKSDTFPEEKAAAPAQSTDEKTSPEPSPDKDAPSTNEPRHRSDLAESIIFCATDMATQLAKAATDLMQEIASLQDLLISRQRELEETEKLLTAAKRFYEEVQRA